MFGAETCSAALSTSTRPQRDNRRSGFRHPHVPAEMLALAIAGLTDLALVEHWASDGTRPSLEAIPELVLTLLLGPRSAAGSAATARP
jgi:hypothetical protein